MGATRALYERGESLLELRSLTRGCELAGQRAGMTPDERVLCARPYDDALGLPGLHLEIVTQGWVGPGGPDADDPEAAATTSARTEISAL